MLKKLLLLSSIIYIGNCVQAQSWLWGKDVYLGKNSNGTWCGVAQDNSYNVFMAGYYSDTLILGTDTLTNSYGISAFLVKFDQNGNFKWIKQPSGYSVSGTVAVDKQGNIYLGGQFANSLIFGSSSLYTNGADFLLLKYDHNGNPIWARQSLGSNGGNSGANSITLDRDGNIYATGEFTATQTFDTTTISIPSGAGGGSYLVKYDSSGKLRWLRQGIIPPHYNSNYNAVSSGYCVATDKYGSAYIGGNFQDTIVFGKDTLATKTVAFYLVKYDSSGKELWARQSVPVLVGGSGNVSGITTDLSGNVYITGPFCDTVSLGKSILFGPDSHTSDNIFLAKYGSSGNLIWVKNAVFNYNVATRWYGYQLATDSLNHIFMCGGNETNVIDTIQFDSLKLISPGNASGIIVEFDTAGKAICGSIVASAGTDPNILSVDAYANHVYFAGCLNGKADFGPDTIGTNATIKSKEAFIERWEPCEHGGEQGINELQSVNSTCILYPDPNKGVFTIQLQVNSRQPSIEIYNMLGDKVYIETLCQAHGDNIVVDISNQPTGIYLYRVTSEKGELIGSGKMVIEK